MLPELVVFVGLQGSGKSSFYRARFADSHALVSKDRFPNNRNPARRQRQLIEDALAVGRSVMVDNTNPTLEDRADLIALGRVFGAVVVGYYFESRLTDCLERNRQRQGKARVPDVALYATRKRLCRPSLAEGFARGRLQNPSSKRNENRQGNGGLVVGQANKEPQIHQPGEGRFGRAELFTRGRQ